MGEISHRINKLIISGIFTCFLVFFNLTHTNATHIRAGQITAERISQVNLTFRITVTGYRDTSSPIERFGLGELNLGDGTVILNLAQSNRLESFTRTLLAEGVEENKYTLIHTYQSVNAAGYLITYFENNRNPNVLNMANSVQTPFYIETLLIIDPFFGTNNTPVLLIPPVDKACVGVSFFHNPGAFDIDGDSLAFRFVIPRQGRFAEVGNYRFPDVYDVQNTGGNASTEDGTRQSFLNLDEVTGDIEWNAPAFQGEYNIAFVVEEWRKVLGDWYLIGYVVRDMQIIVEDCDNERPNLIIPQDTCVVAGDIIDARILGIDPDGDPVKLEAFGGALNFFENPATYTPFPPVFQPSPGTLNFRWETTCDNVRQRPHQIQFKVTDQPPQGPSLVSFATWNITVVGPAPEGLFANVIPGRTVELSWDDYTCSNAVTMQIWRRIDSFDIIPDACDPGMPAFAGYELIDEVPIGQTNYLDNNNGRMLAPGANYCYRLVAVFPQPGGGESIVSAEACALMDADAPVITNVSVIDTDTDNGRIEVKWTPPYDLDPAQFPPPYSYRVGRSNRFAGTQNLVFSEIQSDTSFIDTGLNTRDEVYNYRVLLFDASNTLVDSSAVASSVRLETRGLFNEVELTWSFDVPWSNVSQRFPYHYIYRNRTDAGANDTETFALIDSVNVSSGGFRYLDDGRFNGVTLSEEKEYCYFVTTQGTYGNPIIREPLRNNSQRICAQPNDTIPPCAPVAVLANPLSCEEFVSSQSCNLRNFQNIIAWNRFEEEGECVDAPQFYRVYFSRTGAEEEYVLLANNITDTVYVHTQVNTLAGCYRIAAVDRSGNESEWSEAICNDNCPKYVLPNLITPNGDGLNDVFRPFTEPNDLCPRFVESLTIRIYNRWGKEVFFYTSQLNENNILINWDGRASNGEPLSTGVYYYQADVKFIRLRPEDTVTKLKGWVHVLR